MTAPKPPECHKELLRHIHRHIGIGGVAAHCKVTPHVVQQWATGAKKPPKEMREQLERLHAEHVAAHHWRLQEAAEGHERGLAITTELVRAHLAKQGGER